MESFISYESRSMCIFLETKYKDVPLLRGWKNHSLRLVGVEAGDGNHFGASSWSTGHGERSLLPKVSVETFDCEKKRK